MIGSALFATDRFGVSNSSLDIRANYPKYLSVPPGIYLSGAFTVTVWVYLKSFSPHYARVFDFGNEEFKDEEFKDEVCLVFQPYSGEVILVLERYSVLF